MDFISFKQFYLSEETNRISWKNIENDPYTWATDIDIDTLAVAIKVASDAYYNTGNSKISDSTFDILWDVLTKRDPSNSVLTNIGSNVSSADTRKVKLPYPMPSLDKKKEADSINKWINSNQGPYVISDKMDGISLMINYSGDGKYNLYTRGNGSVGQDITSIGKYLDLPIINEKIAVRAELIIPKSKFNQLVKKATKEDSFNLRNYVSGLVNRKEETSEISNAQIIAYEILSPRISPSQQFKKLKQVGFRTAPNQIARNLTIDILNNILKSRVNLSKYDIDGIVVSQDRINTLSNSNPSYAFAFKSHAVSQHHQATVVAVHWNPSKHGFLKPRVEIEPVKDETGVTIRYVTAHNGSYVHKNKIGKGAIVELVRSGGVIPFITKVIKPARQPDMPDFKWEWNSSKVDIILSDFSQNDTVKLKKLVSFFNVLKVEGLKEGVISKLINIQLDTPIKIIKASANEFMSADGIQSRTAQKIRKNIDQRLKQADLATIMAASGIFGRNMGKERLKYLTDAIPNIMEKLPNNSLQKEIADISMFSNILAKQFVNNLSEFQEFYKELGMDFSSKQNSFIKKISDRLKNQVVVFTGFRDATLGKKIEQNGGEIGNSVNRKTTILVVKEYKGSSKETKARSMGIDIYTIDEFREKYNV